MDHALFDRIYHLLEEHQCSLGDLLAFPLTTRALRHHPVHQTFVTELPFILAAFNASPHYATIVTPWACRVAAEHLSSCMQNLTDVDSGWHFSAMHATPTQIQDFQFHRLAQGIQKHAPEIWDLIRVLLSKTCLANFGSTRLRYARNLQTPEGESTQREDPMEIDDDEAAYWANNELVTEEVDGLSADLTDAERREEKQRLREHLLDIVSLNFLSMP